MTDAQAAILAAIVIASLLIAGFATMTQPGQCSQCGHCQRLKQERLAKQAKADCEYRKSIHMSDPGDDC